MRTLGFITAALIGMTALFGVFVAVRSVPDIKRYLRIRSM
jgi:hypothetical protein